MPRRITRRISRKMRKRPLSKRRTLYIRGGRIGIGLGRKSCQKALNNPSKLNWLKRSICKSRWGEDFLKSYVPTAVVSPKGNSVSATSTVNFEPAISTNQPTKPIVLQTVNAAGGGKSSRRTRRLRISRRIKH